jgi:hypothetical protein
LIVIGSIGSSKQVIEAIASGKRNPQPLSSHFRGSLPFGRNERSAELESLAKRKVKRNGKAGLLLIELIDQTESEPQQADSQQPPA